MQTFLPYSDFSSCAKSLDMKRLGCQRKESLQILGILLNGKKAWSNHPAVKMWRGFEHCLYLYNVEICAEWAARGYNGEKCNEKMRLLKDSWVNHPSLNKRPSWLGNEEFHASHRAALLFKNFEFYSKFNWTEKAELNYIWPVK
jgi:hypothetical protein